ncbi:MAG: hypothetical protein RIE73_03875 [Coleofasciculus sp. C1-SOL-03]|uniref:hypothetical protein n=1 Tax=Coleofasciculus sp. C1-SOL-03 TaxID=3069522 RepID=UPI0033002552
MTETEQWIILIGFYILALLLFFYKNAKLRRALIAKSDQIREIEVELKNLEDSMKTRNERTNN